MEHNNARTPLISIGMPLYNAAGTVRFAFDSLLAQTLPDFELIVSDNASTDATADICEDYQRRDPRVRYVRQPTNLGAAANFEYVLNAARGEFFMWAASDDIWQPQFLERNVAALRANSRCVASVSRVRMEIPPSKDERFVGTSPLRGTFEEKLRAFLAEPGQNSRFYGLFRREQIKAAFVPEPFIAGDWAIMINLLRAGDFHEVPEVLMERASDGASSRLHAAGGIFPRLKGVWVLRDFTAWLWNNLEPSEFRRCILHIAWLNLRFSYAQIFRGR
ncbi:glycosyltransferase family 2 protein [soil metagenome]|jgi:glycosyltransferase involved in cell wall biosynthesis